ncbi:MAG: chorismate mutase [Candidatus Melainabacteria bacterium]|nr:chorismate mutase [Candidatus Melainabacteria bacterium]
MQAIAIRGATTTEANDAEQIKAASIEMAERIVADNQLDPENIIMVFLTMTSDLSAYNASAAIRLGMDWADVPFFTSQEPDIDAGLERCIRILVQVQSDKHRSEVKHVYLGEAAKLRPDLVEE